MTPVIFESYDSLRKREFADPVIIQCNDRRNLFLESETFDVYWYGHRALGINELRRKPWLRGEINIESDGWGETLYHLILNGFK